MPRRPLMVRAALLRRSCDGVADGAAQTSSVALILRIASRRDALNDEPASFSPGLIQISMVVAHSPRPPPWPRNLKTGYSLPGHWRHHSGGSRGVSAETRYGHPASFRRAYGLPVASCSAKRQAMAPTGACARARATSPLSPLSCSHGKRKLRAGTAGAVAGMRDRAGPARTLPAVARGSDLVPRVCCSCGSSSCCSAPSDCSLLLCCSCSQSLNPPPARSVPSPPILSAERYQVSRVGVGGRPSSAVSAKRKAEAARC